MTGISWRSLATRLRAPVRILGDRSPRTRDDDAAPLLDEMLLRQLMHIRIEGDRSLTDWLAGEHEGQRKMQALEFEDYRGYVPGDDFRLIDWNAYARLGDLFVKTSLAEVTISVSLLVDCSRSMNWGVPTKLCYAKRLAAALGALALMHGDRVRVFGLGDGAAFPGAPLYSVGEMAALAADLERLPVFSATDLAGSVAAFGQLAEQRGVVILLSDLLAPMGQIEMLGFLALQGRAAFAIHVIDPAEAIPPLHGAVELRDSETGASSLLSVTPSIRQRYAERFGERTAAIRARLGAADIRYIAASTAIPPIDFVASGLRREGLVAGA